MQERRGKGMLGGGGGLMGNSWDSLRDFVMDEVLFIWTCLIS